MTRTAELEDVKASIKQLKKQWDELDMRIICYDQRQQNFEYRCREWFLSMDQEISGIKKKLGIVDDHI